MGTALRFSVGIPAYNQGEFLEATILSLLNQTRPPDEIVISDHHSSDNTPEIIAKYAAHVRAVKPPRGVNLTGQYNFTLSSQSGDWITLLSSDDVARPRYCEALCAAAVSRDDAVLVRAAWENIDADDAVVSREYMLSVPKVEQPPATLLSQKNGPKVSFAAFAIRREAYFRSGPILASLESLADWALFVQMAPFGSFVYANEILSGYRVGHGGNKFRKRVGMWVRDEVRMFCEVFPLAATRSGMKSAAERAWIGHASRENFLRYLAAASDEFAPEERSDITPLFQIWAEQTSYQSLLQSFAAGERISQPISLRQKAKRILRPIAQNLVAQLRRR
jgi:glycosyltransferase involved in cell wall biosynthesis